MKSISQFHFFADRIFDPQPKYPLMDYRVQLLTSAERILRDRKGTINRLFIFLRLVGQLICGLLITPISYVLWLVGYRFVLVDLRQIGSLYYLERVIRENYALRKTPPKKLLIARSAYRDANPFAYDLYDDHATFIVNPFIKMFLMPFFMNPFFAENTFRFDQSSKGVEFTTQVVWNLYDDISPDPLIKIDDQTLQAGQAFIRQVFGPSKKFVALHCRDSGYYGDNDATTRNADIENYDLAIAHLIKEGYGVVRMGHPNAPCVHNLERRFAPNFFDYAHSEFRSDVLDCYILSECEFFLGTVSGLTALAQAFKTKICAVNYHNFSAAFGSGEHDLVTMKRLYFQKSKLPVPLSKMVLEPFLQNLNAEDLYNLGLVLEENTREEILEAVKETMSLEQVGIKRSQSEAKKLLGPRCHSFQAKGNVSRLTAEYFPL